MNEIITSLFAFPTAIFSVAMGMAVLYWLLVIAGAVDVDLLHIGDHDVGHHGGDHDSHAGTNPNALLEFLRVGQVPLTIIVSLFVFIGWIGCLAASTFVRPHVPGWSWLIFGFLALIGSVVVAYVSTGIVVRPLAMLFSLKDEPTAQHLIGKVVGLTSATITTTYGTARHDRTNGEDLILNVGCEPHHQFKRGDQAVVMEYDRATGVYRIAPLPHTRPDFLTAPAADPAQISAPPARLDQ